MGGGVDAAVAYSLCLMVDTCSESDSSRTLDLDELEFYCRQHKLNFFQALHGVQIMLVNRIQEASICGGHSCAACALILRASARHQQTYSRVSRGRALQKALPRVLLSNLCL